VGPRDVLHYRILGELGQGGMGQVFRALDQKLGREVALKMLPDELAGEPDWQARQLREARAASALNHPGIVTLYDLETVDGHSFLVMELVEGETFSELATRGVPWERAVEIVASVAEALAAAHARGILHRDVKSDNLMLTPNGQVKVLDFGLAKLRDFAAPPADAWGEETDPGPGTTARMKMRRGGPALELAATARPATDPAGVTRAGQILGTPSYMAPEGYDGSADARSDVFSLGVVLYELLSGQRPFAHESEVAVMAAVQLDHPEPPSKLARDRDIPERVDAIVARALAKAPAERYPDMAAFASALRESSRKVTRPRRAPVVAAGIGIGIVAGAGAWFALARGGDHIEIAVSASRRLTFDPGCEEYPHLPPDGRHVIYDGLVGDDYELMMLDLESGAKRQLTTTPGWDYASSISPDGNQVAYVHEDPAIRTLRVLDLASGASRDLGAIHGYPSWTHDGALLVGDAAGHVIRRELGGGDTVLGTLPAGARLYHLVEVPGAGIAMLWWTSSDADATALGELDEHGELRVVEEIATDYEGGLTASQSGRGYYATRKGATEGNQLLFRRWGGGRPVIVPGGISPGAGVDVTRDGRRLVFSTCVERQYIVRITSSNDATPQVVSKGTWQDTNPFVVDDRHVIVTSDRSGQQHGWLLDLEGREPPRTLTPPGALGASPSPDGSQIVYAARGGRGGLAIVTPGGTPHTLTTDPSDAAPVFAHDGSIVFERTIAGVTHVFAVPATGGPARDLGIGAQPAASPADGSIAFVTASDASGARRVMLTDISGSPPRPIPNLPAAPWLRPRFSADGRQLSLVRGFQELVIVTLESDEPPRVVWSAGAGSVSAAAWTRDGTIVAAVGGYEGDLWLADGTFP